MSEPGPVTRRARPSAYWTAYTLWHVRDEASLPFRPLDEILARQRRRVRSIVAHAYHTVPYYREVMDAAHLGPDDFQSADDLARLPLARADAGRHRARGVPARGRDQVQDVRVETSRGGGRSCVES